MKDGSAAARGAEPVTSDATVSSDVSHLTHADLWDNCFSQIQSPHCFLVSRPFRLKAAGFPNSPPSPQASPRTRR